MLHIKAWWKWQKFSDSNVAYKLAVLFKLRKSPSLEYIKAMTRINNEVLNFKKRVFEEQAIIRGINKEKEK